MKIMMLCADWGIPLGGNAGSSVHFRAMAEAFMRMGHEVRIVATNVQGDKLPECPVYDVGSGKAWPAVQAMVRRIRGMGRLQNGGSVKRAAAADTRTETPAPRPPHTSDTSEPSAGPARPSRLHTLYYEALPRTMYLAEELLWHRIRFGSAVAKVCRDWVPDMVYERYALCQTGGLHASRQSNIPYFLEVNAPLSQERKKRGLQRPFSALAHRDEKYIWRRADKVFCVSQPLRQQVGSVRGLDGDVFVTPNGVDTDAFSPAREKGTLRSRLNIPDGVLVGWLGSLSPERGVEEFLELMAPVLDVQSDVHAVIIGGGSLEKTLRRRAEDCGHAGRIHFTGGVTHDDVPALLVDLDLAVASYPAQRDFYFSPMKLYEYMACGLPVVAGDMGQMQEVVEHGVSGELLQPEDLSAWSDSVLHLCRNAEYRISMGQRARERALAFGSWKGNAETILHEWQNFSGSEVVQKAGGHV